MARALLHPKLVSKPSKGCKTKHYERIITWLGLLPVEVRNMIGRFARVMPAIFPRGARNARVQLRIFFFQFWRENVFVD